MFSSVQEYCNHSDDGDEDGKYYHYLITIIWILFFFIIIQTEIFEHFLVMTGCSYYLVYLKDQTKQCNELDYKSIYK